MKAKQTQAEKKRDKKAVSRKEKKKEFDVMSAVERDRIRERDAALLAKPVEKSRIGRPSIYTEELARTICTRIATSSVSLAKLCEEDGMPVPYTIITWRHQNKDFSDMYAQAKKDQADFLADETREIADTPLMGEKIKYSPLGVEVTRGDMLEHRRLQVETRKWLASKLSARYANQLAVTGAEGGPLETKDVSNLTDAQLETIAARGAPTAPPPVAAVGTTEDDD